MIQMTQGADLCHLECVEVLMVVCLILKYLLNVSCWLLEREREKIVCACFLFSSVFFGCCCCLHSAVCCAYRLMKSESDWMFNFLWHDVRHFLCVYVTFLFFVFIFCSLHWWLFLKWNHKVIECVYFHGMMSLIYYVIAFSSAQR